MKLTFQGLKTYSIIYADPPWRYISNPAPPDRWVTNHYQTMSLSEIKSLPVGQIANPKECMLFLWATGPCLPEAFEVVRAWGFTYKTVAFVWVKLNKWRPIQKEDELDRLAFMGMGAYTRANCEYVLLGVRGKNLPRQDMGVRQLVFSPRGRHSQKPACIRDRIVQLYGDVPRVEPFAREQVEGWEAWGDEVK